MKVGRLWDVMKCSRVFSQKSNFKFERRLKIENLACDFSRFPEWKQGLRPTSGRTRDKGWADNGSSPHIIQSHATYWSASDRSGNLVKLNGWLTSVIVASIDDILIHWRGLRWYVNREGAQHKILIQRFYQRTKNSRTIPRRFAFEIRTVLQIHACGSLVAAKNAIEHRAARPGYLVGRRRQRWLIG